MGEPAGGGGGFGGSPPDSPFCNPPPPLLELADELYLQFYGREKPEGTKLRTVVEQLEEELLGGVGEGMMFERVEILRGMVGL